MGLQGVQNAALGGGTQGARTFAACRGAQVAVDWEDML